MDPVCCFVAFSLKHFVSPVKTAPCTSRGLCCCNLKAKQVNTQVNVQISTEMLKSTAAFSCSFNHLAKHPES